MPSFIDFVNNTSRDIHVRVTNANGDEGDENFLTLDPGSTGIWHRNLWQIAFVFEDDSTEESMMTMVKPGKHYSVESSLVPIARGIGDAPVTVQVGDRTITGTVQSLPEGVSPTKSFVARFRSEAHGGRVLRFPASSTMALPAFSGEVTLYYTEGADLTETHSFSGNVGGGNFSMTLDNKVTIVGSISGGPDKSEVFEGPGEIFQVAGSGFWSSSRMRADPIHIEPQRAFLVETVDESEAASSSASLLPADV